MLKVDPQTLDLIVLTGPAFPPKRRISRETSRRLSVLRRSLQILPPRELQFLYLVHAKRVTQQEASTLYSINQQNISHRINRASERIALFHRTLNCSEKRLRRTLFDAGFDSENVRMVTGLVRTTSPSATAKALGHSPGRVRYWFQQAIRKLEKSWPDSAELKLLLLIGRNLYGLSCIEGQERWNKKKTGIGSGDRPKRPAAMRLEEIFHAAL